MDVTRIWFNRWFSEAFNIIDLIRNNEEGRKFEIIVSHTNKYSLNLQNADIFFIEPKLSDEDYIQYCLDVCKRYEINVFLPYTKSLLIAKNIDKFNEINTKILVSQNVELLELINNKALFYDDIKQKNIVRVPDYYLVNNKEEFINAYNKIKLSGEVCFKPAIGVGGMGFRVIKESENTLNNILNSAPSDSIRFKELLELLDDESEFESVIVMEYLEGFEYSIDCLADSEGKLLVAIPRKKIDKYNRYLESNRYLIDVAHNVSKNYKIPYAYNIQVKYKNDEPNLLEINTRMSAGIYYSCMAGVNIPYEAINILLNENVGDQVMKPKLEKKLKLDIMIGNHNLAMVNKSLL